MDINWLEDFVCFARTLNFTRAAAERNITQSAFSRRIRNLELWLGVSLIDRNVYPARLSASGNDFLPTAKTVLTRLRRSRDELRGREQPGQDVLRFAAPHAVSIHHLMPLIRRLTARAPSLRTRVRSDDLHACCETLNQGLCDVLLCYRHPNIALTLDEQRFVRVDLGRETLLPACAPNRAGGARWRLPGRARRRIPYLAYESGSFLGAVVEQRLRGATTALAVRHVDAFAEALKSLALQGAGVAWLPRASICKELQSGALVAAGAARWAESLTLSAFAEPRALSRPRRAIWDEYFAAPDAARRLTADHDRPADAFA